MVTTTLSIHAIREETLDLVAKGSLRRDQPIYALSRFYTHREWLMIEQELELNQYLLRDRISDLVGREEWTWD
ncbi:MAG: DUF4327 domain-containing protein [Cyanobacteria bacterium M5B4]|nr:MAG: DUF4327 domain-containing protein [Cyanobacteria bacterium M5B4]